MTHECDGPSCMRCAANLIGAARAKTKRKVLKLGLEKNQNLELPGGVTLFVSRHGGSGNHVKLVMIAPEGEIIYRTDRFGVDGVSKEEFLQQVRDEKNQAITGQVRPRR